VTVNLAQVTAGIIVTLAVGPKIRSYLRTINFREFEDIPESTYDERSTKQAIPSA
jgi:hypothetical protein